MVPKSPRHLDPLWISKSKVSGSAINGWFSCTIWCTKKDHCSFILLIGAGDGFLRSALQSSNIAVNHHYTTSYKCPDI